MEQAKYRITVYTVATSDRPFLMEGMFKDKNFKKNLVNSILPKGWVTRKDCARAMLFPASEWANMITGNVLVVDGGWTIQ